MGSYRVSIHDSEWGLDIPEIMIRRLGLSAQPLEKESEMETEFTLLGNDSVMPACETPIDTGH